MNSRELRKMLMETSPEFRAAYLEQDLAQEISHVVCYARVTKGWTQEKLAKMVGTKQSGIARTERGNTLPKLDLLDRIAKALDLRLSVEFKPNPSKSNHSPLKKGKRAYA